MPPERPQDFGSSEVVGAPEFPPDLSWLNVDRSFSLVELRGKLLLLWFWSYGSVGSAQSLPDLRRLERKYARELLVLGVHCGATEHERSTANLRTALLRQGIEFPVVNDSKDQIRASYGVSVVPVVLLIDPEGNLRARRSGAEACEALGETIRSLIHQHETGEGLSRRAIAGLRPERFEAGGSGPARSASSGSGSAGSVSASSVSGGSIGRSGLSFPGALLATLDETRLYLSDSGHHRVLEIDAETGMVRRIFGSGMAGLIDGPVSRARFRDPQGLEFRDSLLYVADTGNHVIREIDLEREVVRTVAGTGDRARGPLAYGIRRPGRNTPLSSPWDLVLVGETLYIAMAGAHQIWRLDLEMEELMAHAGSGVEGCSDDLHVQALFDQPSGITSDGRSLFITDSGSSSVRKAGLGADGEVVTLVDGTNADGENRDAAAPCPQHPLGIVWREDVLYLADTYGNAICAVDPLSGAVTTLLPPTPDVQGALTDHESALNEPSAIEKAGAFFYVVDTGHHRVMRYRNLHQRSVENVEWDAAWEVQAAVAEEVSLAGSGDWEGPEEAELSQAVLAAGLSHLHFDLRLPARTKLNRTAPLELSAVGDGTVVDVSGGSFQLRTGDPSFPITIPLLLKPGDGFLRLTLTLYYCEAPEEKMCYYQTLRLRVPIRVGESGEKPEARVIFQLELPSTPI